MSRQYRTLPSNQGEYLVAASTGASRPTIPNYGVTEITSAANTWTLDPPTAGCRKTLYSLGVSSAARVVQLSTDAAAAVKVGNQAATRITFNATVAMCVELLGINSTQWVCVSVNPETAAVNSTGVVIGTS
jgi:hypothetical protein